MSRVRPFSPASKSGLKPLDLIIECNGKPTPTVEEFVRSIGDVKVGQELKIRYRRLGAKGNQQVWESVEDTTIIPTTIGESAIAAMSTREDKVAGVTWVEHTDAEDFDDPTRIRLYFRKDEETVSNLRIAIRYSARDWIFCTDMTVQSGDNRYSFTSGYFAWERDLLGNGRISESTDASAPPDFIKAIHKHRHDPITVRLLGKKFFDQELSLHAILVLSQTIDAYLAMGGAINGIDRKELVAVLPGDVRPSIEDSAEDQKAESTVPTSDDVAEMADKALVQAKALIGKNDSAAARRLKEIVEKFPGTKAADEAQQLIDKL